MASTSGENLETGEKENPSTSGENLETGEKENPSSWLTRLRKNRRVKYIVIAVSGFLAVAIVVASTVAIYSNKERNDLARSEAALSTSNNTGELLDRSLVIA